MTTENNSKAQTWKSFFNVIWEGKVRCGELEAKFVCTPRLHKNTGGWRNA